MAEYIYDYYLEEELTSDNSGFARWGFAQKESNTYFIKEFLSPAYPVDKELFSEKQYEKKKENCTRFEEDKTALYRTINEASDGNVQRIVEFFRCGSKYYIVMEKLISLNYMPFNISGLPEKQKLLFCKVLSHAMMCLHKAGVIHADIKWDNMIFIQGQAKKMLTVKLIDFDNSFFDYNVPMHADDLNIDQVYCSPETFLFLNEEDIHLTEKIDVYAMGLIFHQIYVGELPKIDEKYQYTYEAQLDNATIRLNGRIHAPIYELIACMLNKDPEKRISSSEVFARLKDMERGESKERTEDGEENKEEPASRLKISISREKKEEQHEEQHEDSISGTTDYFHTAGDL